MMATGGDFEVAPRGPFDLQHQNSFFGGWPLVGGAVAMAFPVEGWRTSALVLLRQDDGVDGVVRGTVEGATGAEAERAWRQALAALSLDVDGEGYPGVGDRDPAIQRLQQEYRYIRPVLFHSPYEAACGFTIGHRLSIAQGRRIRREVADIHGASFHVEGETLHAFPGPHELLRVESLPRVAGAKMERLHASAQAALDGWLTREWLRSVPAEEALRHLETLPGIGPFFSQGILYRGAGLVDAVPDDDLSIRAVRAACGLPDSAGIEQVLERAEAWRPFRMWCCVQLHLWYRSQPGATAGLRGGGTERGRRKGRPKT
jgi:DNA-3-methyladenine glycosylase II